MLLGPSAFSVAYLLLTIYELYRPSAVLTIICNNVHYNESLGFNRKTQAAEQGCNDAYVLITILAAQARVGSTG